MNDDITGLVLCGIIFIMIFSISMVLKSGRGAGFLNVYLFMPQKKKELFNAPELCRYYGNVLLIVDILLVLCVIGGIFEITWLIILLLVTMFSISIGSTVYAYTNPRFRK